MEENKAQMRDKECWEVHGYFNVSDLTYDSTIFF